MKQTNRKADLPLLLLAVVLIFLIVCPVGMIFAKAVMQNGRLDFSPAVQTLLNPENAHMIGNSLLLGVLVVLLSTLIAAPLAYLFSRTKFARYRVFDILFINAEIERVALTLPNGILYKSVSDPNYEKILEMARRIGVSWSAIRIRLQQMQVIKGKPIHCHPLDIMRFGE